MSGHLPQGEYCVVLMERASDSPRRSLLRRAARPTPRPPSMAEMIQTTIHGVLASPVDREQQVADAIAALVNLPPGAIVLPEVALSASFRLVDDVDRETATTLASAARTAGFHAAAVPRRWRQPEAWAPWVVGGAIALTLDIAMGSMLTDPAPAVLFGVATVLVTVTGALGPLGRAGIRTAPVAALPLALPSDLRSALATGHTLPAPRGSTGLLDTDMDSAWRELHALRELLQAQAAASAPAEQAAILLRLKEVEGLLERIDRIDPGREGTEDALARIRARVRAAEQAVAELHQTGRR